MLVSIYKAKRTFYSTYIDFKYEHFSTNIFRNLIWLFIAELIETLRGSFRLEPFLWIPWQVHGEDSTLYTTEDTLETLFDSFRTYLLRGNRSRLFQFQMSTVMDGFTAIMRRNHDLITKTKYHEGNKIKT